MWYFILDWVDEEKPNTNILRLIYQGRFLHGNVTLGALQLPAGKTTVMHLVARENLPEPNNRGEFASSLCIFSFKAKKDRHTANQYKSNAIT